MIKEYWDDVDPAAGPKEEGEDEAAIMVERPALQEILPEDLSGATTLAVGCHDHEPPLELARRGARVMVVDPKEEALDLMFQSFAREGLQAELVVSDPLDIRPVGDGSVSLVTMGSIVNELFDLETLYREAHRTLAPGGALLVIVPHPMVSGGHAITGDLGKRQWLVEDYFSPAHLEHPRSIDEHVNTLLCTGFSVERVIEPKPDPRTKGLNNAMWGLFNRIPQLLVLVARKQP